MALPGDPPGELEVIDGLPEVGKIHDLIGVASAFTPSLIRRDSVSLSRRLICADRMSGQDRCLATLAAMERDLAALYSGIG